MSKKYMDKGFVSINGNKLIDVESISVEFENKKPRTFWINKYESYAFVYGSKEMAEAFLNTIDGSGEMIEVMEVIKK